MARITNAQREALRLILRNAEKAHDEKQSVCTRLVRDQLARFIVYSGQGKGLDLENIQQEWHKCD
jgi:hypothetical protein